MCFYDKRIYYYLQNENYTTNWSYKYKLLDNFISHFCGKINFRIDFREKLKRSDGSQSRFRLHRRQPIGTLVVAVCGN